MKIVDAQVHLWAPASAERPWPEGREQEAQRPYPISAEALLFQMDLAGVDRMVLVPPSWEGDRNDVALAAAAGYPDRFAVMGRLPLDAPDSPDRLATWKQQPGMLGVRLVFHNRFYRHLLTGGSADWFWVAAEQAGIPVMVLVPGALDHVDRIAAAHPGLRLVIDHAGVALRPGPDTFADLPAVCALARHPNVALKATGLPALSTEPFPFADLHDPIHQLFDAFGPARTFWGTDLTRMPCPYHQCITLFTEQLGWLAGDDLADVMGLAVCRWLDWPL